MTISINLNNLRTVQRFGTPIHTTDAIVQQLRLLSFKPDVPINLSKIGPTLIGAGYSQKEVLNGLFFLQSQNRTKLVPGYVVVVLTS